MFRLTLLTPPALDPVSLQTAKTMLRAAHDDEDELITDYIAMATRQVENYTRKALIRRTYQYVADRFTRGGRVLTVPFDPILSVTSLTVQTSPSQNVTIDSEAYSTIGDKVMSADWKAFPHPFAPLAGIALVYEAGYGDTAAAVPSDICRAILLHVAYAFEQRLPVIDRTPFSGAIRSLLEPYRQVRVV